MTARLAPLLTTALLAVAVAGCGGDDAASATSTSTAAAAEKGELIVSAAASLKTAFTAYGEQFDGATARFSFAGSDQLAAQIEQGVKPDLFAAANTKLPEQLSADGLVEKPVVFAGNRLVIAVPAGATKIKGLDDLDEDGVTIAAGSESVPVGSYTRKVLGGLPQAQNEAILANVRSSEPDVAGVVGKLTQGAVDAGFVYITDVEGAGGRLDAIALPAALKPEAAYGVAIVKGGPNPEQAQAFVDGLLSGAGQQALLDAGFEPGPK